MTNLRQRLNDLIQSHLDETGMTASALAKAAGIHRVRLCNLRSTVIRPSYTGTCLPKPTLEEAHALLGAMGLSMASLDQQPHMTSWLDVADSLHALGMSGSMIMGVRAMQIEERRWREQKKPSAGTYSQTMVPFVAPKVPFS